MTATVCMLATLLVLSNGAQLGGAIFCVGSDDLVDVDVPGCTCCADSAPHDERDEADGSSCRDCVEVPLKVQPVKMNAAELSDSGIDAEGWKVTATGDRTSRFLVTFMSPTGRYRQTLLPLSTIVLLT